MQPSQVSARSVIISVFDLLALLFPQVSDPMYTAWPGDWQSPKNLRTSATPAEVLLRGYLGAYPEFEARYMACRAFT